ncbi:winged helix-turn-helix transcriptional regulator [Paenibacillus sepulcri]|uniref:Helix-turn-helix transcriptional regulator n=1 Tax=Paenibacillus sepulcri TaxID=359917 RepID=A0ABS7BUZ1_9BACL|nr:helix-turn-helix transcriptional regulator [Paenibacillus sepulcri]
MTKENPKLNDIWPDQITTTEEQQLRNGEVNTEHEEECDINIEATLRVLSGKWKLQLLYELVGKTRRFNDLRRRLSGISQKMLTQQLRELEEDGLVNRNVIPDIPPKVEYSLTVYGHTLGPMFDIMFEWGANHRQRLAQSSSTPHA